MLSGLALVAAAACPPAPALSYAPQDVGLAGALLSVVDLAAGIACVGIVGSLLRWSADDHAPLRPLWMALIVLGFAASATGLYLGFANRAHTLAVESWLVRAAEVSITCLKSQSASPNLMASSVTFSIELGVVSIALIVVGILGAVVERRRGGKAE